MLSLQKAALVKTDKTEADVKKAITEASESRNTFLASEDRPSDQKILATTVMMFYNNIDKSQHSTRFYESIYT